MATLYVVIVTYNGASWIKKCLESVYNSTIKATPIVIDNCSTDSTLDVISTAYPQTVVIVSKKNIGFGQANNIGIKKAVNEGAEYVYLLNQDAWVDANTFDLLIKEHKKNQIFGVLSPMQLAASAHFVDYNFLLNSISLESCPNLLNDYVVNSLKDVYETAFVMAAHWLLYVPTLKKIGLFSPAFSHYGEDANLIHRYNYFGFKIGVCPKIFAYHDRQGRIVTPEKKLYFHLVDFLTQINNPNINTFNKKNKSLLSFVYRSLMVQNCGFKIKMKTIFSGLLSTKKAKIYKRQYIIKNSWTFYE